MKIDRKQVYAKYDGHCGYCGREIEFKEMQIDHMFPKCGGGSDEWDNLMPSCKQCNHYKRSLTIEKFRNRMEGLHRRIEKTYINRVAINFGIVTLTPFDGTFYFEKTKLITNVRIRNKNNK